MKNFNTAILIVAIFTILTGGCSKTAPKICGSKEVEQELIKKASDQGLIPKALTGKIQFSILNVEQVVINPEKKESEREVVCTAQGKLEYTEDIQKNYLEIRKSVGENFSFADNYFPDDLHSFKKIAYKVKKNQLNDGVIIDGSWVDERQSGGPSSESATQLSTTVLDIIEKKEKIFSDLKDVSLIFNFMRFVTDKKEGPSRPGKQVLEYVVNNRIPVRQCTFHEHSTGDFFSCRIAGDHAALNVQLHYEDFDQITSQVLDGKKLPHLFKIRDESIEQLFSRANKVYFEKDSFEVFRVTLFSEMDHIIIK